MRTSTLLATVSALALTATAAPALTSPSNQMNPLLKERQQCGTIYPNLRNSPTAPPPYQVFISSADASGIEIGFSIPSSVVSAGTGPCELVLDLSSSQAAVYGSAQVNVYALDGPDANALVGTTQFYQGSKASISSWACREQMCFRLEVAEESEGKQVSFEEVAVQGAGFWMKYGC
ncbi:hypothetical protein QC763_309655 [Podospora pseudopauciseta]|uniref:Ubiquitin 3 binding protein But2 C-terminal domain-containing protein n=2 Tax=Podospora TaxID=5144 RepID=A0ABR0HHY2_9PEZI|nr:hypothetical protein QC763_309655 [Podospora pseudopauciseta]KAK4678658.1 hypothetical protein QC764_309655 [Podospora pseudoanserina]